MNKHRSLILSFIAGVLVTCGLLFAASAPADARTVLSTSTANGVTTTYYVGRVQTDPSPAGGATLTVYRDKVITDSAGSVLASGFDGSFQVPLTSQQYAGVAAIIKATYDAQNP